MEKESISHRRILRTASLVLVLLTVFGFNLFAQNRKEAATRSPIIIDISQQEKQATWTVNNQSKDLPGLKALLAEWWKAGDRSPIVVRPHLRVDFATWLATLSTINETGYTKTQTFLPIEGAGPSRQEVILRPVEKEAGNSEPHIRTVPTK